MNIDRNVYTFLKLDCTAYDFTNISKVVLTIKNGLTYKDNPIITKEFTESGVHEFVITPSESFL